MYAGQPHTTANLLNWARGAVNNAESLLHVKINSIVTDRAPNMEGMKVDLESEFSGRGRRLYAYRCQTHLINLIFKEINTNFKTETSKVNTLNLLYSNVNYNKIVNEIKFSILK